MNTGGVILLIILIILILAGLGIGLYFLLRKKTPSPSPSPPSGGGTGGSGGAGGSGGTSGIQNLTPPSTTPPSTTPPGGTGGTEPGPILNPGGYFGPSQLIWSDDVCPNIGQFSGVNLTQCESQCNSTTNCTAINFNGGPEPSGTPVCVLRACPIGTQPNFVLPRFSGFAKYSINLQ